MCFSHLKQNEQMPPSPQLSVPASTPLPVAVAPISTSPAVEHEGFVDRVAHLVHKVTEAVVSHVPFVHLAEATTPGSIFNHCEPGPGFGCGCCTGCRGRCD